MGVSGAIARLQETRDLFYLFSHSLFEQLLSRQISSFPGKRGVCQEVTDSISAALHAKQEADDEEAQEEDEDAYGQFLYFLRGEKREFARLCLHPTTANTILIVFQ